MALLNTIYYTAAGNYQQLQVSSSTKRELEALGIDPSTVASESQARQIIDICIPQVLPTKEPDM